MRKLWLSSFLIVSLVPCGSLYSRVSPIDQAHTDFSRSILTLSNWLDSFFGDVKSLEDKNGTNLRIYTLSLKKEREELNNEINFKFQINLPNLKKRLNFTLEKSSAKSKEEFTATKETNADPAATQNSDVKAGLSYFLFDKDEYNIKLSSGIRLRWPPYPYANLRFSHNVPIGKLKISHIANSFWELNNCNSKKYRVCYGEILTQDFDYAFSRKAVVRWTNNAIWNFKMNSFSLEIGPSFYYIFSKRRAASLNLRSHFNDTELFSLKSHTLSTNYRQRFHKDWLFGEIGIFSTLQRAYHWRDDWGVVLKLEAILPGENWPVNNFPRQRFQRKSTDLFQISKLLK
ncbi:MAG: hypothetical protein HOE90_05835 [Bacteriovoracaceae bacterium]|jgi:hypothetical protein|nr:hypothetical protein [Bacteriovoracaceae bacterium]